MQTKTFVVLIALFILIQSCVTPNQKLMVSSFNELDYGTTVQHETLDHEISLAYTESGSGNETILFIHGLGSYLPAWNKNISDLNKNYRSIAIDLPGYGKSSKGNYPVSMEFYADLIAQFCAKKGIQKVNLAGHSMGGQISISTALKYPQLVDKLILIAPAGFETFNKGQRQWFRDVMTVDGVRLTTAEQIRVNYAYNFYNMPDDADFMINDRLAMRHASEFNDYCYHITQGVEAMVNFPVFDNLKNLNMPVLVIFGENDNLIPNRFLNGGRTEKYARAGTEQIKNAQLYLIPEAGHFVQFEKSTEVNQYIKSFLQ